MTSAPRGTFPPSVLVAHRGGAAEAPENTLEAIAAAVALGCFGIEIDVRRTADDRVILFHDDCVAADSRAFAGRTIESLTFAETQVLDVGGGRTPVPPPELEAVLDFLAGRTQRLMIEVKCAADANDVRTALAVRAALRRAGSTAHALWGSLSAGAVRALHALLPQMPIVAIIDCDDAIEDFLTVPVAVFAVDRRRLLGPGGGGIPRAGAELWSWTVNDADVAHRLLREGVERLITDRPRAFIGGENP